MEKKPIIKIRFPNEDVFVDSDNFDFKVFDITFDSGEEAYGWYRGTFLSAKKDENYFSLKNLES